MHLAPSPFWSWGQVSLRKPAWRQKLGSRALHSLGDSLLLEGTEEGGVSVLEAEAVKDFRTEKCCRTPPMAGEEDTPKVSALAQWAHLQAAEVV